MERGAEGLVSESRKVLPFDKLSAAHTSPARLRDMSEALTPEERERLLRPGLNLGSLDPYSTPEDDADEQAKAAIADLDLPASSYLRLPFKSVDALVGGTAPGSVTMAVAFSGHGKSTFVDNALDAWYVDGKKVYVLPLETRPKQARTRWACLRTGYNPGDALSGELKRLEEQGVKWATEARAAIKAEVDRAASEDAGQIYFAGVDFINVEKLWEAGQAAKDFGADVLIVDHIDHVQSEAGGNLYEESVDVAKEMLKVAQRFELKILATSQLNNEAVKDPIALHQPPRPHFVKFGGHKREVVVWMLGLYRPTRIGGVSTEDMKAVRNQTLDLSAILEPNCMAVSVMKHRYYGNREGKKCYLRVEHGRLVEVPERDLYATEPTNPERVR